MFRNLKKVLNCKYDENKTNSNKKEKVNNSNRVVNEFKVRNNQETSHDYLQISAII